MTTTFIGIDLAWQSDKNHSGIVVSRGNDDGAIAELASSGVASLDAVVSFVQANATANTVIAIDAPLVIRNVSGQRPCETEVSSRFGRHHAGAHSTNLSKYPDAPPCRLVAMLEAVGFAHDPRPHTSRERDGKWMFEVYPHPAMVNLFRLDHIIRYKKGSISEKRQGLILLRNYLAALRLFDPPLNASDDLEVRLFHESVGRMNGKRLKHHEDLLDAYFCSYLALYFWRFGAEKNEMIGDVSNGYIIVPHRPLAQVALGEGPATFVNPVRFVIEEGRLYDITDSRFGSYQVVLRWMPDDFPEGRSIAYAETPDREHGLGLQRIDLDTEDELRGLSGMVGEFTLRATAQFVWGHEEKARQSPAASAPPAAPAPMSSPSTRSSKGTTTPGYINRNLQEVIARTEVAGSDHRQRVYRLRCGRCGAEYGANGSDIFQRKCPECQGGKPGDQSGSESGH